MLKDRSAFWQQTSFAVVGVSQNTRKFGRIVYEEMKKRGHSVAAVNPRHFDEEGLMLYPHLAAVPPPVGAIVVVVPPAVTEEIVREAHPLGIRHVWMQPGAESASAIRFCEEQGINVIHGECILLQMEPVKFPHNIHRWVTKLF
jgi:hypothetical protein